MVTVCKISKTYKSSKLRKEKEKENTGNKKVDFLALS